MRTTHSGFLFVRLCASLRREEQVEETFVTKIDVGVLGATGMVGQQFVSRLEHHPWFNVKWLAASERSEGKSYTEASSWRLSSPMPEAVRNLTVDACVPGRGPKVVFSALDAGVAGEVEEAFARAGHIVLSNARNHRMDPLIPLLIPEINGDHLSSLPNNGESRAGLARL